MIPDAGITSKNDYFWISSVTEKLRTVWVSVPRLITSAPVRAYSRIRFSDVIPPESSMVTWSRSPACSSSWRVFRTLSGCHVIESRISAPARAAARASSAVSTSISIFRYMLAPFARRIASLIGTRTRWLSLISTPSLRPDRWGSPPPRVTAFLSSTRSPGQVLRVPATRAAGVFCLRQRHKCSCPGCNPAHPADNIERGTFHEQDLLCISQERKQDIPGLLLARRRGHPAGRLRRSGKRAPLPQERPATIPSCSARITARQVTSGRIASEVISPEGASSEMNFSRYSSGTVMEYLPATRHVPTTSGLSRFFNRERMERAAR